MAPSPADAARPRRLPDLAKRAISAAVLGPLVLAAVWHGFPWFDALLALASLVMLREWARMCGGLARPLWMLSGAVYILGAVVAMQWLRHEPETGLWTVLWLLAAVWATDIGAYFAGRRFGGAKLAPRISPNKTWAGLFGGMAAATVASVVVGVFKDADLVWLALMGALLAVVSQIGDLLESAMKRRFGVKDSGRLIPGHGGMLDRVDGVLAAILLVAGVRLLHGGRLPWS